jgi:hypothetical protein
MITRSSRIAFVFAAMTAATVAAPITASFAAMPMSSADETMASHRSTGVYDANDQYRTAQGFPQSGWQYLSLPPS